MLYETRLTLVASGDVSQFGEAPRGKLKAAIAATAGVPPEDVTLVVRARSLLIDAFIFPDSARQSSVIKESLAAALAVAIAPNASSPNVTSPFERELEALAVDLGGWMAKPVLVTSRHSVDLPAEVDVSRNMEVLPLLCQVAAAG